MSKSSWWKPEDKSAAVDAEAAAREAQQAADEAAALIQTVSKFVGPKGDKGDKGDPGVPGDKGERGYDGSRGPLGPTGATGFDGVRGPTGLTGPKGDRGPKGDKGDKGDPGKEGPAGKAAELGKAQISVVRGPQGNPGNPGAPGVGVPAGGTTAQVLSKTTNTDYDTSWVNAAAGGGGPHPDLAAHDTLGLATDAELASHVADADPHTGYQKESEKDVASGYAGLTASSLIADAQIPLTNGVTGASAVGDTQAIGTGTRASRQDHRHGRESFGNTAAAIGTSAGGSATTPSKSDHVHATGALTPTTQAFGDAAATGSGPAAAMTDHKHAMPANPTPSYATNSIALGTAAAAGSGTGIIRPDATILAFDATAPSTQNYSDAAVVGVATVASRRDHKHAMPAVGAASAGGADKNVQFNDGGTTLGGATNLNWDKTTNILALTGASALVQLPAVSAEPATPGASLIDLYARSIGGRMMLKQKGPSGLDTVLQPAIFQNRINMYVPSTGTTGTGSGTGIGPVWTAGGTVTHPNPSSTAPAASNQMKRTMYANVVTTTNQTLGITTGSSSGLAYWRGNAAGLGGFFYAARFIVELYPASTVRIFAGLAGTTTHVVASDTVVNHVCGLWHDTTDPSTGSGAFNFVTHAAGAVTKTAIVLSNAIAAGNSYDFYMFAAPNDTTIYFRLDDLVNNVTYEGSATATLPANTTFMGPQVAMSNGTANLTVTTTAVGVAGCYVESDR